MTKLMISEIMHRFNLFEENTIHVEDSIILNLLRDGFRDIHGAVGNCVVKQFVYSRTISKYDYASTLSDLDKQMTRHKWFKVHDTAFATVVLDYNQVRIKHRRFQIKLIEDGYVSKKDMVPFIKFYSNPQGILMIERIMFDYV